MNDLLTIFIAVTAVAVVLQMAILLGIFLALRKTAARVETVLGEVQSRALPVLATAQSILADAEPKLKQVTADLVETTAKVKSQVQRMDGTLHDALDRARLQVIRTDEMLSQALDRVEETSELVHRSVTTPVRKVSALVNALSAGMGAYFGKAQAPRTRASGASAEEELFI